MFAKDSPWGQPQAESQTQLFVTHLPVTMATGVGGESANCWAGKREGRRLCPPRWQDCLFLARLLLPEADFSLQEAVGKKGV